MNFLQANYLKILSALTLFFVGLGSLTVYGYDLLLGKSTPQAISYVAFLTLAYCLHQIGYQLGAASTADTTTSLANQLGQAIQANTDTAIATHVQDEHATQNAIPSVKASG